MKQKYTLTVANSEIHIVTEEDKQELNDIVGAVDRRIREIHLHSKSCSRVEAALILCLEYCAEKNNLQKMIKAQDAEVEHLSMQLESAEREKASLEREIDSLRQTLKLKNERAAKKAAKQKDEEESMTILSSGTSASSGRGRKKKVETGEPTAVEKILADGEQQNAPKKRGRKPKGEQAQNSKVRAMFDMISFDDI